MEILFVFAGVFFWIWQIRNIIFWTGLWQLKEYRFDRVLVHLKQTRQGKYLLFSPLSIAKWLACIFYAFVILTDYNLNEFRFFVFFIYLLQFASIIREYYLRLDKRPVITAKIILICTAVVGFNLLFFLFPLFDKFFWFIFLDRFVVVMIGFSVFVLSFPTEIYRDLKVQEAMGLMEERIKTGKKLLIIGITGSYGKSSTKEYIAQILSRRYNVLSTKGTNNTPIGIAKTIINGLTNDTEIFVVEMGAYKRGEISEMCNLLIPDIGVLTSVNEQHLALFGSLRNTIEAKYELIESLPKDGIALFNGNNENTLKLFTRCKKSKILFVVSEDEKKYPKSTGIVAKNVQVNRQSVSFDVIFKDKKIRLTAPLLGAHTIENMLPGIYIAHHLGIEEKDIMSSVSNLIPVEKTMIFSEEKNGTYVIDDTFNANPEAVIAAAKYSQIYNAQKIMVMQPMIELGSKTYEEHERVAAELSNKCEYLLVTNRNYIKAIKKGLAQGDCKLVVGNTSKLSNFLLETAKKGSVIVFEGKESYFVLDKYRNSIE